MNFINNFSREMYEKKRFQKYASCVLEDDLYIYLKRTALSNVKDNLWSRLERVCYIYPHSALVKEAIKVAIVSDTHVRYNSRLLLEPYFVPSEEWQLSEGSTSGDDNSCAADSVTVVNNANCYQMMGENIKIRSRKISLSKEEDDDRDKEDVDYHFDTNLKPISREKSKKPTRNDDCSGDAYKNYLTNVNATSYVLTKKTELYHIANRFPRFVVWPKCKPLTINATALYYCENSTHLLKAVTLCEEWTKHYNFYSFPRVDSIKQRVHPVSVIVFDLDETLIPYDCYETDSDAGEEEDDIVDTGNVNLKRRKTVTHMSYLQNSGYKGGVSKPLAGYKNLLKYARRHFNYVIIWSHGNALHVQTQLPSIDFSFDYKIHSLGKENEHLLASKENLGYCKNLLYLYNILPTNVYIKRAILVDDSPYNWSPEYDTMIVPLRGNKTLDGVLDALKVYNNCNYNQHRVFSF